MAEWLVKVQDVFLFDQGPNVPAGSTLHFTRSFHGDGSTAGYWVVCPKCGEMGHCSLGGSEGWLGYETLGLTLHPSVVCPCGGHYWVVNGVLREA